MAISGKPGLYKLVSKATNMLIVESLDEKKKRIPAHATDKIVSIANISIYTDDGQDTALPNVFESIKKEYDGKIVDINHKNADKDVIIEFFKKVLPNYDVDRVHVSDMRKVIAWYNILVKAGITDFVEENKPTEEKAADTADSSDDTSDAK